MRSLARYLLTGPIQATIVIFGFAVLSFPFPILLIFSGGALVLVMLQQGFRQGVSVLAICILLMVVSGLLVFGKLVVEPLTVWITIMVIATIYLNSKSLNVTLQLLTLIGLFLVLLISIIFPDLSNRWLTFLQNILQAASKDPSFNSMLQSARLSSEKIEQYLPIIASVITGGLIALYLLVSSLMLFFGRWWQEIYTNTQAFRKEFISLKLGKVLAILAILFVFAGLVVKHAILWQLAIVCLSMFSIQGMAIVHALVGQLSSPIFGFIAVYGLLFIVPQVAFVLSALGVLDSFINFRIKLTKSNT